MLTLSPFIKTRVTGAIVITTAALSLLSITGKLFARVALNRLQVLAEKLYPEPQAGFRAGRSTTDLLSETVAGEVQRAEKTTLHGLH